jgi:bacterioferritin-associated ferredoxin
MIICLCNNITELELQKLTLEEFEELRRCGICKRTAEEVLNAKISKNLIDNKEKL